MFVLEAKFQTHGIAGAGGIVLMVLGALLLVDGPYPGNARESLDGTVVAVPLGSSRCF